jgi:uncharacterized protein (DUF1684 family)
MEGMTELDEFRAEKDAFFGSDQQSPLTREQQRTFEGLHYYSERPDLAFEVEPELYEAPERIEMLTSTGGAATYERWAKVRFEVEGEPAELTVYRDAGSGELFLPFQDANAGGETYGAGRYLEVPRLADGRLLLDFNYAYNPYCAYNEHWSCPIPPPENHLRVAIRAGEMTFEGH